METTVADLINGEHMWDVAKLNQHFMHEDTEVILQIPIPSNQYEDEILWHYDKRGEYTVKSGYQVALKTNFPDAPSNSKGSSKHWSALWSLELPEKIKIFMWKTSKNILPTFENLWKRKCLQDLICQRCSGGVETSYHALTGCKVAKKIWDYAPFPFQIQNASHQDI